MKRFSTLLLALVIIACTNDETSNETESSDNTLTEALTILTDGDTKTWVIEEAILTNGSLETGLDITSSLNVTDDRFIFSTEVLNNEGLSNENASVLWKQREVINWEAASAQELFKDFYASDVSIGLEINEDNPATFRAFEGLQDFTIVGSETITGVIQPASGVTLQVTLRPFTDQDNSTIPTSLDFTEVASFILDGSGTIGCTSSALTNTIYFSERPNNVLEGCDPFNDIRPRAENLYTFNISTGIFEKLIFCQPSGFVTKELEVIDGDLVSLSSATMNTYPLDLSQEPEFSFLEFNAIQQTFSRQGTATLENDIYVIGGNITFDYVTEEEAISNTVFKFNTITNSLELVTTMPSTKFFSDGEIIDNKLYIFGGINSINDWSNGILDSEDHIYIYDFQTDTWTTEFLPEPIFDTFTARYQDLIYIGGNSRLDTNNDGTIDDLIEHLAVYNTSTGEVSSIPYTLGSTAYGTFRQITILGNKIYLLVGSGRDEGQYKLFEAILS